MQEKRKYTVAVIRSTTERFEIQAEDEQQAVELVGGGNGRRVGPRGSEVKLIKVEKSK